METKLVQKEKKAEEPKGKFDENGKMMIPFKQNGKTSLKTQEQMKSILDKKDKKQKVNKKTIQNNKQSKTVKQKKQANPKFRDDFASKAVEQIQGLERKDLDDKVLLKYGKSTLARLMLRVSSRFTAYRRGADGERLTMGVKSDKDEAELLNWIEERVTQLKVDAKQPKKNEDV